MHSWQVIAKFGKKKEVGKILMSVLWICSKLDIT